MTKITNVKRTNDRVEWTVTFISDNYNTAQSINYRTDENGCGIFFNEDFWYTKQIYGICDFQLRQKTMSGVRKALNKFFADM